MALETTELQFSQSEIHDRVRSALNEEHPTYPDHEDDDDGQTIVRGYDRVAVDMTPDALAQRDHIRTVEQKSTHALLGRRAVDVLVAAAVSHDGSAVGRVAGTLIDQIHSETGPVDIITPNDEIRMINAAADFAREVEDRAHSETIDILKARIAELEGLVSEDVLALKADLRQEQQANAKLTTTISYRDRTIASLQTRLNKRDLRKQAAIAMAGETLDAPSSLRQRLALGARSAAAYFGAAEKLA